MYRDRENGGGGSGTSGGGSGSNHLPHSHLHNNHHSQHNNRPNLLHQHHLQSNGKPVVLSGASNGAGPLPVLPSHKSHPRLIEPSLSRWTANPVSLPPHFSSSAAVAAATSPFSTSGATTSGGGGILGGLGRTPSQVPTVPQRNNNCISDNWVDLEELYRWLQELEDTKIEEISDEDHSFGKPFHEKKHNIPTCHTFPGIELHLKKGKGFSPDIDKRVC